MRIKEAYETGDNVRLRYDDLCVNTGADLLEGYKILKFKAFNDTGNPMAHLRRYCDQMVRVGRNEALLMRLFIRSLSVKL